MQKQECYLCGYPSEEYVLFPVPLASPKKEYVVCIECAVDIVDLLDKKGDCVREIDEK